MEHNFMMSDKGRENFKNQLQQVVGSIQYTNDLDVHIALITAVSYAKVSFRFGIVFEQYSTFVMNTLTQSL